MEPDELFQERYRVVGQLGTGGQSNVYRADEVATGRRVAIKLLHDHGDGVRFIREGRVVSRLSSPNTVRLIEFDRADSGRFFMVFEYIAGENLAQVARRDAPLPWATVAKIARQVLQSLAEAHALGIVHRDIKPSNIMLAPGGEAKVLDFGVAHLDEGDGKSLTETGEVLGTPRYVSPESLSGEKVTAAADVYAVGLVAWELLVGRPANDARNGADIVLRHLDPTPYRLPTDIEIPEGARRWVSSMCNKNAARRPRDAAEALIDLEAFEPAPRPLVAQDDDHDDEYDSDADESHTGVLSADEAESTTDPEEPPELLDLVTADPTQPDPWRPEELNREPEPDPTDPSAPPPPPQPRSTGIPGTGQLQAVVGPPVPIKEPWRPTLVMKLLFVAFVAALAYAVWITVR